MDDLDALEARLEAILDPYRDRLEDATIYNIPVLRRADAKAHDWFGGVQRADPVVKFNFLPMYEHPELLEGVSEALIRKRTGASVFKFRAIDDELFAELESLVARAFETYTRGT